MNVFGWIEVDEGSEAQSETDVPLGPYALSGPVSKPDPRTVPLRGDIAHVALAGRYFVPHYVVPRQMMVGDMGADVIRVERPGGNMFAASHNPKFDVLNRNKRCVCVNLKDPEGVETVLTLLEKSDALLEGNRPGVMERLGLGPDVCQARNPALVYGRMTGWGQEGPLARAAGHDINYVALSGALHGIGRAGEKPAVPLILHFGTLDAGIPMDEVELIGKTHPHVTIHIYEGADHGFNCEQRKSYNAGAAKLALERTLAFFGERLG